MGVRAAIGLGANLGDAPATLERALDALSAIGSVVARSRFYRTKPWGVEHQPDFVNAVALLETGLEPQRLLQELKAIERRFGRVPGERWGPRVLDLDILTYGGRQVDEANLQIPHPRLLQRAFALIPLAEVEPGYRAAVAALDPAERAGVFPLERGETVALMSDDTLPDDTLLGRIRELTAAFLETDLVRLRIEDANEDSVELRKPHSAPARAGHQAAAAPVPDAPPERLEPIKADLVGIFHFSRPPVMEGERLEGDRELGYVEALGIRNPVRSLSGGRVAKVRAKDAEPVDYGRILFEIDRG